MNAVALTVCLPAAPPRNFGRVLASVMRADRRDAVAFADRNADTWREVLEPGESRFLAVATDRAGRVVFVREYHREQDTQPTEYRRAALREMRGSR